MDLRGSKTEKNLLAAFTSESRTRILYENYANIAKNEGYIHISNFFIEASKHELSHAKNFSKFFETGISEIDTIISIPTTGNTINNLENAIQAEKHESTSLYLTYAEVAHEEGFTTITAKFKAIAKAEAFHYKQFSLFLNELKNNTHFIKDEAIEWYCIKCGYIHYGTDAPKICPACNHPQSYFTPLSNNVY